MVKLVYISSPYKLIYLFLRGEHLKSTLLTFAVLHDPGYEARDS